MLNRFSLISTFSLESGGYTVQPGSLASDFTKPITVGKIKILIKLKIENIHSAKYYSNF